jgi:hypothetical protein
MVTIFLELIPCASYLEITEERRNPTEVGTKDSPDSISTVGYRNGR